MITRRVVASSLLFLIPFAVFGWGAGLSKEIDDLLDAWFDIHEDSYLEMVLVAHLEEGEDDEWQVDVDPADYFVLAVCDYDCEEIDLCANETCNDNEQDMVVGVYVSRATSIDVSLEMVECDEPYCYYAILIVQN